MDVLIVGGTRFVGYQLAWRLIAGGQRVTLLNRGTLPDPFGDRVQRLRADHATDAFARALASQRFDACIDFATYTADDARRTLQALTGRVGHHVMISTGQVYLVRRDCPRPTMEKDYDGPLMPEPDDPIDREEWSYGIHKREAEDVLDEAWSTTGFPSTRLRIPMVNGERDHFRRIETYLWRMLDGGPLIVPGGGRTPVRHVYGGSVVRAIVAMLGDKATFGQAYNLAQDETPTLTELLHLIGRCLGADPTLVPVPSEAVRGAGLDVVGLSPFSERWMSFLDPTRARQELGFRHEPLETYLDKVVTSFVNNLPAGPPDSYARRPAELRLASSWLT